MRTIVLAIAVLALFACTFTIAQETAVSDSPRFAEMEHEDATTLAEQEADYDSMVSNEEGEDEAEEEGEEEEEEADQSDEEAEAEEEETDESEESDEAEAEEGESEESAEAADEEEAEETDEEEDEAESEGNADYVLAELKDNAVMTGFMEMIAHFVPTAARTAEHMVHSLSSHQQAAAQQHYAYGYAHGHADAVAATNDNEETDEEDSEQASFVEGSAKAESESPVYTAQYYAGYPSVAGVYYQPMHPIPAPPQLPTWLPPPPYITPAPSKAAKGGDE